MSMFAVLIALVLPMQQQDAMTTARVVVFPANVDLSVGSSRALSVVEEAYNVGDKKLADATVQWFSTDPDVVTVDESGLATATGPGTARIAAVVDGVPGYAVITVPQLPPARVVARVPAGSVREETSVPIDVTVLTNRGDAISAPLTFSSSTVDVATVDGLGRVYGHRPGNTTITVSSGSVSTTVDVEVVDSDVASFDIDGPNEGLRTGDVARYSVTGLSISGETVTGFYPAWSVSGTGASIVGEGTDGVFVAERPGTYIVTAVIGSETTRTTHVVVGERSYEESLQTVGRGPSANHHSSDMWVFEGVDGRDYAYVGTFMYDWAKVWDVTDPTSPVLTDSVQLDARRINDVKIHPNGRLGILTREGASNRRNGIVLLDLSDPAHPTILSEYTDTVTGGVHNVWILPGAELVYAVHNGTRDIHIIDIGDPERPVEVGRWGLENEDRSLHDVIVQDGYAYVSYWNDGIVILDAGAGTHGGTARNPKFVSQLDLPTPNTHVAWRQGRYLFVGDEIWPDGWTEGEPIEARGYVHVLDASDIENLVEVARYEVPEAGAHNLWADDERLYIGYYQGGLRVVDITGELRGDLYRQGREVGFLRTTDADTFVPNWPFTWGAQLHKGHIYSSDMNSGLWIMRLATRPMP